MQSRGVERGASELAAGALARTDHAPGIANARGTDEAADYDEPAGDADADPEGLEGRLA
jgi:hypothetical protein